MNQAHIFATYIAQSNPTVAHSLLQKHNIYAQNEAQTIEGLKQLLKNEHTFHEVIAIHPDKELFDYAPIISEKPVYSRIDGEPTPTPQASVDTQKQDKESNSIKIEIPAWLLLVAFLWLLYKLFTLVKFKSNE
jgi:hypothetical protein